MKHLIRPLTRSAITTLISLASTTAYSADWAQYIGFSYISGAQNVWDWYDDNFHFVDGRGVFGLDFSYRYAILFESDLRFDASLGPVVAINGDIHYHDLPFQLTLGYDFPLTSEFRTYARLGASYHFNDGDYIKNRAGYGAFGAVGFEYGKPGPGSFFMEASYDSAKATFLVEEGLESIGDQLFRENSYSKETIKVSDFQLTVGLRF
ncbi:MAG: hypothetical protein P8171_22515 [Candidatus Thiodiazotropha sp.]